MTVLHYVEAVLRAVFTYRSINLGPHLHDGLLQGVVVASPEQKFCLARQELNLC